MLVSWYVDHGVIGSSGLFCIECHHAFKVDRFEFYSNFYDCLRGEQADKPVFCPYCGCSSVYPRLDIDEAEQNYKKYREFINI